MKKCIQPRLSLKHRIIYYTAYLFIIIFVFLFPILYLLFKQQYVFSHNNCIAYNESAWFLILLFPCCSCCIPILILNSKYKKGINLFQKVHAANKIKFSNSKDGQKSKKIVVLFCTAFLIINLLVLVLPFFPRTVLTKEGQVEKYNICNQKVEQFDVTQFSNVNLAIKYQIPGIRTAGRFVLSISFQTNNDEEFNFLLGDFCNFDSMFLVLDRIPSEKITIAGVENLDVFLSQADFSEEQKARIIETISQSGDGSLIMTK